MSFRRLTMLKLLRWVCIVVHHPIDERSTQSAHIHMDNDIIINKLCEFYLLRFVSRIWHLCH